MVLQADIDGCATIDDSHTVILSNVSLVTDVRIISGFTPWMGPSKHGATSPPTLPAQSIGSRMMVELPQEWAMLVQISNLHTLTILARAVPM